MTLGEQFDSVDGAEGADPIQELREFSAAVLAELNSVYAAHYSGTDEAGHITATVDGRGRVVGIDLARSAARLTTPALNRAVQSALTTATARKLSAIQGMAERLPRPPSPHAAEPAAPIDAGDEPLARLAATAQAGTAQVWDLCHDLGRQTLDETSSNDEVRVTVDLYGGVVDLSLRPHAVRDLDLTTLGEVLTGSLRTAQQRAQEAYDDAVTAAVPPELAAYEKALGLR